MWKIDYKKAGQILNTKNTGCPEYQIIRFVERIISLTEHINKNKHDFCAELCLRKIVGKNKALLKYLEKLSKERKAKLSQIVDDK